MPVSRSKNRGKLNKAKTRNKEETKRLNRIRGQIGNMQLGPKEAQVMYKALKDKSTPIQYLNGARDDISEILGHFKLIRDTRDYINGDEKFEVAFKQRWGSLYGRVIDAAEALDELYKANDELHEQHREEMESLGDVQISDNWIACIGAIEGYDNLRASIEEVTLSGIGYVMNDLIKATYAGEEAHSQQEVVRND